MMQITLYIHRALTVCFSSNIKYVDQISDLHTLFWENCFWLQTTPIRQQNIHSPVENFNFQHVVVKKLKLSHVSLYHPTIKIFHVYVYSNKIIKACWQQSVYLFIITALFGKHYSCNDDIR